MGISSAVDWWEEWQLRVLVLGSLFIQYLLLFSAPLRKLTIPSWFRSIMWLAYLGSDAVAIYALANLFSRQRRQDCTSGQGNSILEVVWAPVLLMHLGGQDSITAYNIEDNELWTRHVLTAVSQITVAIYVFCKSWTGGDKRLLQASILFFVPGILKCIEKPWSLMSASFNSLVSSSSPVSRAANKAAHHQGMERWNDQLFAGTASEAARSRRIGNAISLEDYVRISKAFVLACGHSQARKEPKHVHQVEGEANQVDLEGNHHHRTQGKGNEADLEPKDAHRLYMRWWLRLLPSCCPSSTDALRRSELAARKAFLDLEARELFVDLEARKLFVDLASPYHDRLSILEIFLADDANKMAYSSLQLRLFKMFELLYTKANTVYSDNDVMVVYSMYLRMAAMCLPFAAIGLFHKSHREAYDVNDVMVTYVLFCCTAVLEMFSIFAGKSSLRSSGMVAQYSLVGFFVRNKRHNKKICILSFFKCKDFLDKRWSMKPRSSSSRITALVLVHVKDWWQRHIVDVASYRKFNDHRGQWTIQRTGCNQNLGWSINRPFDESVLLWHIATDLCFYYMGTSSDHRCAASRCGKILSDDCATWCKGSPRHESAKVCRQMSNYMIYLLFVNPEMLLPGTRRNLFLEANNELNEILKGDKPSLMESLNCNRSYLERRREGKGPLPKEIERDIMNKIILKLQTRKCRVKDPGYTVTESPRDAEGFVQDAWKISEVLLRLGDEKMWQVIEGVWVEMLCFSASRCRGFLHAKSMASGISLLTYVWFLLSRMGMETLPERLQRTELSSGEGNAGAPPSTSQTSGSEEDPRRHEAAAVASASTSRPQEIQPAE